MQLYTGRSLFVYHRILLIYITIYTRTVFVYSHVCVNGDYEPSTCNCVYYTLFTTGKLMFCATLITIKLCNLLRNVDSCNL